MRRVLEWKSTALLRRWLVWEDGRLRHHGRVDMTRLGTGRVRPQFATDG